MGGRVSDIAIDPRNPFVFYVALGHGGIFKSGDAGVSFDPIFDKQPDLSIGAIAIAPSDSDVIWVGTGEANDRNSSDWGAGVYPTFYFDQCLAEPHPILPESGGKVLMKRQHKGIELHET